MTVSGATSVCAGGDEKRHSWVCVSGHSFAMSPWESYLPSGISGKRVRGKKTPSNKSIKLPRREERRESLL